MKERVYTGFLLMLILLFAILSRSLSLYIFDALIILVCIFGAYESSKLFSKMGYFNESLVVTFFPIAVYAILMISIKYNVGIINAILFQIALIILTLLIVFVVYIFSKAFVENEMKTRKIKQTKINFIFQKIFNTFISMLYPTILFVFYVALNHIEEISNVSLLESQKGMPGLFAIIMAFLISISTDIFSMLFGMLFGGKKLCSKISPNKTISGAVGGIIFTMFLSIGAYYIFNSFALFEALFLDLSITFWKVLILSFVGSLFCNFGDLFESFLKRKANVKDSGQLLAGHGGVLDRIDSHTFCAFWVFLFLILII